MKGDVWDQLIKLKKKAQSDVPSSQAMAQFSAPGHVFEVKSYGRHPFGYVLKDGWYDIQLSKPKSKSVPLAYCRIASSLLTTMEPKFIVNDLETCIRNAGTVNDMPSVSRADLCVDFVTQFNFGSIDNRDWVTRARDIRTFTDNRVVNGYFIGGKGTIVARLYNKTLELKNNPRPYLENLWHECGWDGSQTVWRLEFELKRDALRDLGIVSFSNLDQAKGAVWEYCTNKWLRLTIPNPNDKTQSRWSSHPIWDKLSRTDWGTNCKLPAIKREPDKTTPPSDRYLFINGLAAVTSYMAREGITNFDAALEAYGRDVRDYHDERAFDVGEDFENYITRTVRDKFRRYGTAENVPLENEKDFTSPQNNEAGEDEDDDFIPW